MSAADWSDSPHGLLRVILLDGLNKLSILLLPQRFREFRLVHGHTPQIPTGNTAELSPGSPSELSCKTQGQALEAKSILTDLGNRRWCGFIELDSKWRMGFCMLVVRVPCIAVTIIMWAPTVFTKAKSNRIIKIRRRSCFACFL